MRSEFGYMIMGVIAGACICLEGTLNSLLGRHVGVIKAALAPFGTGLIALIIAVFILDRGRGLDMGLWLKAPWYSYLGGLSAAIFVCLIIFIVPKVGISSALASVIAGQLITALVFDATGLFSLTQIPISPVRVIGALFLLVGMRLMFVHP